MTDTEAKLARVTDAIRTINKLHNLGDACYAVRESEFSMGQQGEYNCDSWSTPAMKQYGDALDVLKSEGVL